jgi:hypothetical protein
MEKMRRAFSPLYESRRQLFANAFMALSQTLEARVIEHVAAARLGALTRSQPFANASGKRRLELLRRPVDEAKVVVHTLKGTLLYLRLGWRARRYWG